MAGLLLVLSIAIPASRGDGPSDALADIVGPVTPYGTSPWPWYDKAAKANADEIIPAALRYVPRLGPPAAGTFELKDGCNITLTGNGAAEFKAGDWAIVGWNVPRMPPGGGRLLFIVKSVAGTVMTSENVCSLGGVIPPSAGIPVYHCEDQCRKEVLGQTGHLYDCTLWGLCNFAGNSPWGFYDPGLALYRMYLRTRDEKYLTLFRNYTDTWWTWALDQGARILDPPRGVSLVSQFVRALDGHPERLPSLYGAIKRSFDFHILTEVDGNDNRETGYTLLFAAVGARADSDASRRAFYCSAVASHVKQWLSTQTPEGYWSEKIGPYPVILPGVSPWRMFSVMQGLARSYDVLNDPSVCNDKALAAKTLASVTRAAGFAYRYGYAANGSRGVYYDVQYPAAELDAAPGPGSVSVALGSKSVTGSGTAFLKTFAPCNGTTFLGIPHTDGLTWTHAVVSCQDNSHLTLGTAWGTQCMAGALTHQCATTAAEGEKYLRVPSAPTNCASLASHCWTSQGGGPGSPLLDGDRNNDRDLIWIMGWLYKTTGQKVYKAYGDELFSASYGGPKGGPGDGYPGKPGPCGGPGCDGTVTDYIAAIHACAADPRLPCNPDTNYPGGNVWVFNSKRWAQGSGIGGADNYLAWRGTGDVPLPEYHSAAEPKAPRPAEPARDMPKAEPGTEAPRAQAAAAPPAPVDAAASALLRSVTDPDGAAALFTKTTFPKDRQPDGVRRAYIEVQLQRLLARVRAGRCREVMGALETLGDEDQALPFTLYGFGSFVKADHFQYYVGSIEESCGDEKAAKKRWARIAKVSGAFESVEDVFPYLALQGMNETGWQQKVEAAIQSVHAKAAANPPPEKRARLQFIEGWLLIASGRNADGDALLQEAANSADDMVQFLSLVAMRDHPAKAAPLIR